MLGCLWLGRGIVTQAMSDQLAAERPEEALLWRPDHPLALAGLADAWMREAGGKGFDEAEATARLALAADPLEVAGLRIMGLTAAARGDLERAYALMSQAGLRTRRDSAVQMWLTSASAARGDYATAFLHADALVRARPEIARQVYPAMAAMAEDPRALEPLAKRLQDNPPWRERVVLRVIAEAADPRTPDTLLALLKKGPAPPTERENAAYVSRLASAGLVQQAFVQWVSTLSAREIGALGNLYDGEFDGYSSQAPFNWTIDKEAREVTALVPLPGAQEGRALRLMLSGKAPARFVRQLLALGPGRYVFRGEVEASHFEAAGGLQWSIRCTGDDGAVLAATSPLTISARRQTFTVALDVPADGCEGQLLQLRTAGARRAGSPMVGEVWYDHLQIAPAA